MFGKSTYRTQNSPFRSQNNKAKDGVHGLYYYYFALFIVFFFTLPRPLSLSCAACFLPAILRLSSTPRWWSKRLGWTNHRAFMALAPSAPPLRSSASPPPRTAPSRRTPPSRGTRHSQQSCTSGPRRCTAAAVRSSWAPAG